MHVLSSSSPGPEPYPATHVLTVPALVGDGPALDCTSNLRVNPFGYAVYGGHDTHRS